jgi:hypothetical protein
MDRGGDAGDPERLRPKPLKGTQASEQTFGPAHQ